MYGLHRAVTVPVGPEAGRGKGEDRTRVNSHPSTNLQPIRANTVFWLVESPNFLVSNAKEII